MNTCFLCIQSCDIKTCTVCNTYCHVKCLSSYIKKFKPICPVCKSENLIIPQGLKLPKKTLVYNIENYIYKIQIELDKEKKLTLVDNFFNYISDNITRINQLKSLDHFRSQMKVILYHLYTDENWEHSKKYFRLIFNESIQIP